MYVTVIIGVTVVVYAACKYVSRFNPSPIHIKGVGFAKSGAFTMNLMFVECRLVLLKSRGFS